ncbi:nucleoprotein TPR/MLP1 domain-containing protein [Pseudoscourfieldia marina]
MGNGSSSAASAASGAAASAASGAAGSAGSGAAAAVTQQVAVKPGGGGGAAPQQAPNQRKWTRRQKKEVVPADGAYEDEVAPPPAVHITPRSSTPTGEIRPPSAEPSFSSMLPPPPAITPALPVRGDVLAPPPGPLAPVVLRPGSRAGSELTASVKTATDNDSRLSVEHQLARQSASAIVATGEATVVVTRARGLHEELHAIQPTLMSAASRRAALTLENTIMQVLRLEGEEAVRRQDEAKIAAERAAEAGIAQTERRAKREEAEAREAQKLEVALKRANNLHASEVKRIDTEMDALAERTAAEEARMEAAKKKLRERCDTEKARLERLATDKLDDEHSSLGAASQERRNALEAAKRKQRENSMAEEEALQMREAEAHTLVESALTLAERASAEALSCVEEAEAAEMRASRTRDSAAESRAMVRTEEERVRLLEAEMRLEEEEASKAGHQLQERLQTSESEHKQRLEDDCRPARQSLAQFEAEKQARGQSLARRTDEEQGTARLEIARIEEEVDELKETADTYASKLASIVTENGKQLDKMMKEEEESSTRLAKAAEESAEATAALMERHSKEEENMALDRSRQRAEWENSAQAVENEVRSALERLDSMETERREEEAELASYRDEAREELTRLDGEAQVAFESIRDALLRERDLFLDEHRQRRSELDLAISEERQALLHECAERERGVSTAMDDVDEKRAVLKDLQNQQADRTAAMERKVQEARGVVEERTKILSAAKDAKVADDVELEKATEGLEKHFAQYREAALTELQAEQAKRKAELTTAMGTFETDARQLEEDVEASYATLSGAKHAARQAEADLQSQKQAFGSEHHQRSLAFEEERRAIEREETAFNYRIAEMETASQEALRREAERLSRVAEERSARATRLRSQMQTSSTKRAQEEANCAARLAELEKQIAELGTSMAEAVNVHMSQRRQDESDWTARASALEATLQRIDRMGSAANASSDFIPGTNLGPESSVTSLSSHMSHAMSIASSAGVSSQGTDGIGALVLRAGSLSFSAATVGFDLNNPVALLQAEKERLIAERRRREEAAAHDEQRLQREEASAHAELSARKEILKNMKEREEAKLAVERENKTSSLAKRREDLDARISEAKEKDTAAETRFETMLTDASELCTRLELASASADAVFATYRQRLSERSSELKVAAETLDKDMADVQKTADAKARAKVDAERDAISLTFADRPSFAAFLSAEKLFNAAQEALDGLTADAEALAATHADAVAAVQDDVDSAARTHDGKQTSVESLNESKRRRQEASEKERQDALDLSQADFIKRVEKGLKDAEADLEAHRGMHGEDTAIGAESAAARRKYQEIVSDLEAMTRRHDEARIEAANIRAAQLEALSRARDALATRLQEQVDTGKTVVESRRIELGESKRPLQDMEMVHQELKKTLNDKRAELAAKESAARSELESATARLSAARDRLAGQRRRKTEEVSENAKKRELANAEYDVRGAEHEEKIRELTDKCRLGIEADRLALERAFVDDKERRDAAARRRREALAAARHSVEEASIKMKQMDELSLQATEEARERREIASEALKSAEDAKGEHKRVEVEERRCKSICDIERRRLKREVEQLEHEYELEMNGLDIGLKQEREMRESDAAAGLEASLLELEKALEGGLEEVEKERNIHRRDMKDEQRELEQRRARVNEELAQAIAQLNEAKDAHMASLDSELDRLDNAARAELAAAGAAAARHADAFSRELGDLSRRMEHSREALEECVRNDELEEERKEEQRRQSEFLRMREKVEREEREIQRREEERREAKKRLEEEQRAANAKMEELARTLEEERRAAARRAEEQKRAEQAVVQEREEKEERIRELRARMEMAEREDATRRMAVTRRLNDPSKRLRLGGVSVAAHSESIPAAAAPIMELPSPENSSVFISEDAGAGPNGAPPRVRDVTYGAWENSASPGKENGGQQQDAALHSSPSPAKESQPVVAGERLVPSEPATTSEADSSINSANRKEHLIKQMEHEASLFAKEKAAMASEMARLEAELASLDDDHGGSGGGVLPPAAAGAITTATT